MGPSTLFPSLVQKLWASEYLFVLKMARKTGVEPLIFVSGGSPAVLLKFQMFGIIMQGNVCRCIGDWFHLSGIRHLVVISSKCGVDFDYAANPDRPPLIYDFSRANVRKCVEESLSRLKTDYIDFYLQARIDPKVSPEEAADTMAELIKEGKVLHWGVSEADGDYLRRAHAVCPITVVENSYSIINRNHEKLIPFLEENNIGWVAHGPLFKGLLTGIFQKGTTFAADDWRGHAVNDANLQKYAPLLQYLEELGKEKEATPVQLALAWILHRKPYIVPIPGMKRPERLAENMAAADIVLTEKEMAKIDECCNVATV